MCGIASSLQFFRLTIRYNFLHSLRLYRQAFVLSFEGMFDNFVYEYVWMASFHVCVVNIKRAGIVIQCAGNNYAIVAYFLTHGDIHRAEVSCIYLRQLFVVKVKLFEVFRLEYLPFLVRRVILILLVKRLRSGFLAQDD